MTTIPIDEAEKRFGALLEPRTRTYRHFDDESGGIWRPEFNEGKGRPTGYKLYRPARPSDLRVNKVSLWTKKRK